MSTENFSLRKPLLSHVLCGGVFKGIFSYSLLSLL